MSFLNGNCCLKLNYLICGSKNFSSKKKKSNLLEKSIINEIDSSPRILLSKQNSSQKFCYSEKNNRRIKNSVSQNSSIDHRLSDRSYSTLNNEIITKDVILHRNNRHERLGLTICYGLISNCRINIYIEQVEKNSIAYCQGKLERGDQIIKINNQRVTSRDQAIQLIHQSSTIILQIIPFKFFKTNFSRIGSTITEDDSGVILVCNTDLETIHQNYSNRKSSISLSCFSSNNCQNHLYSSQIKRRRCLSLNDLTNWNFFHEEILNSKNLIHSQSLFDIETDNEKRILKPLPFKNKNFVFNQYSLSSSSKQIRRKTRQQYLNEQHQLLITTDDEKMSEFKQGKYWTKEQRKKQFQKSKKYQQRKTCSINTIKEDFHLLNRIFLRENKQELVQKPYLAIKYKQQSNIEKQKLKQIIQKYPLHHPLTSKSTTNISINTNSHSTSSIFI